MGQDALAQRPHRAVSGRLPAAGAGDRAARHGRVWRGAARRAQRQGGSDRPGRAHGAVSGSRARRQYSGLRDERRLRGDGTPPLSANRAGSPHRAPPHGHPRPLLVSLLRPGTRSGGGALCHGRGKLLVRAGRRPAAVRRQLPAGPRGGPIHRPNDAAQGRGARPDGADHGAGVPALGGGAADHEEPRDRDCAGAASTVHAAVRRGRRDDSPGSGGHTRTGDHRDLDPGTGRASGVA